MIHASCSHYDQKSFSEELKMSKEVARRQWADDDEDDDREVNSSRDFLSKDVMAHPRCH